MVAAVATEEPEIAAKTVEDATLVWSRPPGSQVSQSESERYMRWATSLCTRISPIRM
jgi:hypothetical protein